MARVHGSLPGQKCADFDFEKTGEYDIKLYMVVGFTTDAARVIKCLPVEVIHQEYTQTRKYLTDRDFLRKISTGFGHFLKKYLR